MVSFRRRVLAGEEAPGPSPQHRVRIAFYLDKTEVTNEGARVLLRDWPFPKVLGDGRLPSGPDFPGIRSS
jgi:hypothetical protein